jgi:hypothetical protein
MTKSGWVIIALTIAILLLGFFQIRSCRDTTADSLARDKDSLSKENSVLAQIAKEGIRNDSVLRIDYKKATDSFQVKIDSLSRLTTFYRQKATSLSTKLQATFNSIDSSVINGNDSDAIIQLETLKREFSDYKNQTEFGNQISDAGLSVYKDQMLYDDSVITQKNKTIDSLVYVIGGQTVIINKLMADIDKAIKDLRANKRVSFASTFLLIVVGAFALFKK